MKQMIVFAKRFVTSDTRDQVSNNNTKEKLVHRVRQVFQESKRDSSTIDPWERLWRDGLTPWDLGGPTPALLSEVQQRPNRHLWRTALLPGCGSGYDVVSLARFWDDYQVTKKEKQDTTSYQRTVVGLDLSETSLHRAKQILDESVQTHGSFSRTNILLYQGDFFAGPSAWHLFHSENTSSKRDTFDPVSVDFTNNPTFDFIFDYTFFCAIPPERRHDWGRVMTQLLSQKLHDSIDQSGELLTLMFPYVPAPRTDSPGPPYLVSFQDYLAALDNTNRSEDGKSLRLTTPSPYQSKDVVESRFGQEMVGWWKFESKKE
ncbi:thiopurine S-methyltransferase [Nitzschia inconspicua]|uniref:Thiopurine S-methyltransferase n=1 Tax=Nitzschia inconspicua TaxID=303405 RepID=A0A9K3KRW8_9STRA|nr:thiopurine S-methyltransferase [Nitzschia inconspicua]